LGTALLAGHILVACPAAAITAVLTFGGASIRFDSLRPLLATQLQRGPREEINKRIVWESMWQDIKDTTNRANLSGREAVGQFQLSNRRGLEAPVQSLELTL
jgi:hypothetical protein